MREAVRDLGNTLEEAASKSGLVTGLVDSIGKALSEVCNPHQHPSPSPTKMIVPRLYAFSRILKLKGSLHFI